MSAHAGAALALCSAAAASASDPVQDGDQADIVVTGTPEEVDRQIRDFVGALTEASPRSQLRRFEMSVCPGVAGLPAEQRGLVMERMRRVALAVGMRLGGPDCQANILLMVVDDKKSFIDALTREHPEYFGQMSNAEIRGWRTSPARPPPGSSTASRGPPTAPTWGRAARRARTSMSTGRPAKGSLITSPVRVQLHAAAVVVERGAHGPDHHPARRLCGDADLCPDRSGAAARDQPADHPQGARDSDGRGGACHHDRWDLSFLKGLYSTTGNLYAASQRSEIRRQIEEDLTENRKRRQ